MTLNVVCVIIRGKCNVSLQKVYMIKEIVILPKDPVLEIAKTGRPQKIKTVQELDGYITEYFDYCRDNEQIPTLTGLALICDITRKNLMNYPGKEAFRPTLKRAKQYCEYQIQQHMLQGKKNPVGYIFSLKNNHDWRDEHITSVRKERIIYKSNLLLAKDRKHTTCSDGTADCEEQVARNTTCSDDGT